MTEEAKSRNFLAEANGKISTMRIMSLGSLAIAGGLSFVALAKDDGVAAIHDLVLLFLVGAFAPKLLQRAVEKNWSPTSQATAASPTTPPNDNPKPPSA